MASARLGFRKTSKLEVLATFGPDANAQSGWRKSAASRGTSHFAQANATSVRAILEAVGDKYFISKDPKDYIFAVYRAVTEDEPNGNGDAFPREELLSWNRIEKKPVYRTFEFKPRFVNHQADDLRMSRGVCLDTHYNEVDPEDRFVEVLVAYDTKKDPILAQAVIDGTIGQCSMGCDALKTVCNVCGNEAFCPDDYCLHIKPGNRLKNHRAPDGTMKLAFEWCYEVTFQELSDVDDPADKKADIQEVMSVEELPSAKIAQESEMLSLKARIKRLESTQHTESPLQMVASQGENMSKQVDSGKAAAKKQTSAPEHHVVANSYAKHHEAHFGDHHAAMKACMEETGKSEQEVKACWDKKMAEDAPHEHHEAICASLNAQLKACGDMKKAIKRAAEDHEVDHATVEKCAEHMKHANKMPKSATAPEAAPAVQASEAPPAPVAQAEPAAAPVAAAADAPAAEGEKHEADKDGPPAEIKEKIEESAKTAARKLAGESEEEKAAKKKAEDDAKEKEAAAKAAQEQAPAPVAAADPAAAVQAADAPNDKSLGDMGVKTGEEAPADKVAAEDKDKAEKEAAAKKAEDDAKEKKEAAAKTAAAEFPFAKFYQDVSAKKASSGDIHVSRAGKLVFTVPAVAEFTAKKALSRVAQIGLVGAMKEAQAFSKKADLGIAEGAVSDVLGGRPVPPASIQDGAQTDGKDKPAAAPASTTAQGATTDMKDKTDKKNLGNSDVRDGASTDTVGGHAASPNSMIDKGENSNAKDKHKTKNVGSDNVLSQHQVDFVTQGLDPRSAKLIRDRLAKIASEAPKDEAEKEAAKKAEDEAKEKEAAAKKSEEEVEKKAQALVAAKLAKFERGLRMIARRTALNLEPCYLKYNLGAVLSNRHEASGFEGMDSQLVSDVVMRGISLDASLDNINHLIKRAKELSAMPEDSLGAIEADMENLEPVHPQASSEDDSQHESHTAQVLRRRASSGSLPVLRSPATPAGPVGNEMPTKQSMVRSAIGGGILGMKYPRR